MKPSTKKNQKLMDQFPVIRQILSLQFEPFDGDDCLNIDDLNIRVQVADGDLMYRQADNFGLGDNSCVIPMGGSRQNQARRQAEYVLAIGHDGQVLNVLAWPRNTDEERGKHEVFAGNVFFQKQENGWLFDSIHDQVEFLVWLTVGAWHEFTGDYSHPESQFGKFIERVVDITVYQKPSQGFLKLAEQSCMSENLCLTSNLLIRGYARQNNEIIALSGSLQELCRRFQDRVYLNGMKHILDKGEFRGASGQFGPVKVLCAEMCGRDRVMLEGHGAWISFQDTSSNGFLGYLGMDGTLPQLRRLVETVIELWNRGPKARQAFRSDEKVSVF